MKKIKQKNDQEAEQEDQDGNEGDRVKRKTRKKAKKTYGANKTQILIQGTPGRWLVCNYDSNEATHAPRE